MNEVSFGAALIAMRMVKREDFVGAGLSFVEWPWFDRDPSGWFIGASPAARSALWRVIEPRMRKANP